MPGDRSWRLQTSASRTMHFCPLRSRDPHVRGFFRVRLLPFREEATHLQPEGGASDRESSARAWRASRARRVPVPEGARRAASAVELLLVLAAEGTAST